MIEVRCKIKICEGIAGTGNVHGFTGKELDGESGLNYFCQRYYDAQIGRFMTLDPVDDKSGISPYAYCSNNPLKFTDPTGEVKNYAQSEETFKLLMLVKRLRTITISESSSLFNFRLGIIF